MKLLLDFLPIALFFGAFKLYDIYVATGVLMAATVVQTGLIYFRERKLATLQKVTLGLILVFGTLTLALHDERFVKAKPTVLYLAMAIALAVAAFAFKKNMLKALLGSQLQLPEQVWMRLNIAWIVYSLLMAAINAYVAMHFTTEAWVNFKLWGYAFPLVFIAGQGIYIAPHLKHEEPAK